MQAQLVDKPVEQLDADTIIVPILEGEKKLSAEAAALDKKLAGAIGKALNSGEFKGEFMEQLPIHSLDKLPAERVLLVGLGKASELDPVRMRNALQGAARYLRRHGTKKLGLLMPSSIWSRMGSVAGARAATEGIGLGNFEARSMKTKPDGLDARIESLSITGLDGERQAGSAVKESLRLVDATNRIREWVNLPANAFTPTIFVERVRDAIKGSGLDMKVLEMDDMRKLNMGALLAVARGSDEPAKMIILNYKAGKRSGPMLALVGKGITFDSGGISIKPGAGMEKMKSDMGGGAAVVGAMLAISDLKPDIDVIGVVPTTENMPSGKATKPGDVVTASNGKTVEIVNTDAEGRLILADAITYAINQGATHVVDAATLTGSIARTLGPVATGAFGNNPELMKLVEQAADEAGERVWELPTWADYDGLITSSIADIKNSTVQWAGATTAALFIREFVADKPWVHLDIAGSAWQDAHELKTIPRGPTGAGVRLLARLAQLLAKSNGGKGD